MKIINYISYFFIILICIFIVVLGIIYNIFALLFYRLAYEITKKPIYKKHYTQNKENILLIFI